MIKFMLTVLILGFAFIGAAAVASSWLHLSQNLSWILGCGVVILGLLVRE